MTAFLSGCASASVGSTLDHATRIVSERLGLELKDFDWVCCGGSSAMMMGPAYPTLAGLENLSRARKAGEAQLGVECAGCIRHVEGARTQALTGKFRPRDAQEAEQAEEAKLVEVIPVWEKIARRVMELEGPHRPGLCGLKVASYYGCRYGRGAGGRPARMGVLEEALRKLGAEVVEDFPRADCNGGMHTITRTELVEERTTLLVAQARQSGAELVAVLCPVCQVNLETRSLELPIPAPYFVQLVGLALGIPPVTLAIDRQMVSLRSVLGKAGVLR